MSKNPYFAHLPTWRNRQDLAYAIDSLPSILETLAASSPLLATYSYPSTSCPSSSSSYSSHSSLSSSPCSSYSSSSTTTSSSSCFSSTPLSYSSPPPSLLSSSNASSASSAGLLSPAKSKASVFKERFMLDLAKEYHRSLSRSPSPSTATPNTTSRRVSDSIQSSQQQLQQQQQQQYQNQANRNEPSPYYPLQFSTRARAMAYLIEILQSLQKDPCGCDLVRGCYCGTDGIEDHEGKSPCYVCGEWYPDRRESSCGGGGGGGYEGDMDSTTGGGGGASQQRQGGKAWHEQGSLRHHVAEAKVKKWLDSVWKPPLTPATTPEQENVKQFGLRKSQEDLHQCSDHPQYPHQHQHRQQQQHQYVRMMEPVRPWSVHDIEIEARTKSRSRNNSASSTNSMSFASSPSFSAYYYPPTATATSISSSSALPQQDLSGSAYGYASSSGSWHFNTSSPSSSSSLKPIQATPPFQRAGPLFWAPQPIPTDSRGAFSYGVENSQQGYQSRIRTMSCSDAPLPSGTTPSFITGSTSSYASMRSLTPPVLRSNSIHTSHINSSFCTNITSSNGSDRIGRSKPVRASTANSTFAIPQEILDPNYKSPTFRIKSWSPASSSLTNHTPATTASSLNSIAPRLSFMDPQQEKKKPTLDEWTATPTQSATAAAPSPHLSLSSSKQEFVLKSSTMDQSNQEDGMPVFSPNAGGGQQGNTCEDLNLISASRVILIPAAVPVGTGAEIEVEVKKSAPFQLNFTSSRFRAAVQAKASMDNSKSSAKAAAVTMQQIGTRRESVQKSSAFPDNDDKEEKEVEEEEEEEEEEEDVLALPRYSIPAVAITQDSTTKDKKMIATPALVDVVIISEEVDMCDPENTVAGGSGTTKGTTVIISSKTTSTSSNSMHSQLSIQKSAPLSSPTTTAASVKASSSSASSVASTSASASASASTSAICSPDPKSPKSPKKDIGKSNASSEVQQASNWSSLQKTMQTMSVSATAGPSSSLFSAATTPVWTQGSSMLHVDATSQSS